MSYTTISNRNILVNETDKNSYHLVGIPTINIINSKFILYAKIMRAVKKKQQETRNQECWLGNFPGGPVIKNLPYNSGMQV